MSGWAVLFSYVGAYDLWALKTGHPTLSGALFTFNKKPLNRSVSSSLAAIILWHLYAEKEIGAGLRRFAPRNDVHNNPPCLVPSAPRVKKLRRLSEGAPKHRFVVPVITERLLSLGEMNILRNLRPNKDAPGKQNGIKGGRRRTTRGAGFELLPPMEGAASAAVSMMPGS